MSTYEPIASQTVGTVTPSITFSSLPQNYTDLVLVMNGGHNSVSGFGLNAQFNNDVGSNYSSTVLRGNGSVADSFRYTSQTALTLGIAGLNNLNNATIIQIQNYSNSATNKTVLSRNGGGSQETWAVVGLWRNISPINSIRLFPETASWLAGTTFTIYGVAAGNSSAKASGGNIVTTDGTYWYHTFTSSGVFIPSQALTVDYLVVAGGGAGGGGHGGGGGAGGLRSTLTQTGGNAAGVNLQSALSLSANAVLTAVVGAGGAAGLGANFFSNSGSNSLLTGTGISITTTGGGRGGSSGGPVQAALGGGSGGGGTTSGSSNFGAGTANEGYNGGFSTTLLGGGGGGAGAAGQNQTGTSVGGTGGAGVALSVFATATNTGVSNSYAGGGGGAKLSANYPSSTIGIGGSGGGGNSGNGTNGVSGVANTGSGGGAGDYVSNPDLRGGNGGSGIIIVRYAV